MVRLCQAMSRERKGGGADAGAASILILAFLFYIRFG